MSYLSDVSYGRVIRTISVNGFGLNTTFPDGNNEDVWDVGGNWIAPITDRIHDIKSTATEDTDGQTGAHIIAIFGLDEHWNYVEEFVTMNGINAISTVNSYSRIYRMSVQTAGSNGGNVGTITATAQIDDLITAQINPANNQTLMAVYSVPLGHDCLIHQYYVGASADVPGLGKDIRFGLQLLVKPLANEPNRVFQVRHIIGINVSGTSYMAHRFIPPMKIAAISDVKLRIVNISDVLMEGGIAAGFDLELREKG